LLALLAILRFAISDRIYIADQHGSEVLARLSRAPRFTRWMADAIRPYVGDRVLEIGAGIGNLTVNLIPRDVYWATDVNPTYLRDQRHLRRTRPYLRTGFTDVTRPESFPVDQQFDTVICLNVVEHLQDDVAALRNIRSVLQEDGKAIVLVPQGPGLYGSLDKALGHFRRYTREELRTAAERADFQVINVFGFNKAGVPAWWLNARLLNRKTFSLYQIKMLNLLVPLFRKLEAWLPFPHLSLIAVLKKPAFETETQK
jgi:SAM-dependent methyltransferase